MYGRLSILSLFLLFGFNASAHTERDSLLVIRAFAANKAQRNKIVNLGIPIDGVASDYVTIFGTETDLKKIKRLGIRADVETSFTDGFPSADGAFHDYTETLGELDALVREFPTLVTRVNVGKSLENRELAGVRISADPTPDNKPTAILMGCHHAREHLSVEVPLKMARYLASEYATNARVKDLLDSTEIYIVPMVNPDGAEYDIKDGRYQYWRKNRRKNSGSSYGVDLNRNYGKGFGGPGSSNDPSSDTYHGPSAFSEPETQAVRDFVRSHKRTTVLLSFHTFSELVLWPYGYTDDEVPNDTDRKVFEAMGKKMAGWNGYTAEKSSELYLASGDTTDWAYDELKIFAYTFELSPSSMFSGGFYPGAKAIEPTFKANLEPMLYLIDKARNPYLVLSE